ncbi:MAG: glycosyltransferase [Symploca sp. SIO1C4]|uniref:Glycosyltransferase n=1 Tax=Symploca sp. SIO1C4 TaxID=2607765 RepID=A0A6B3NB77_9CYAN|nr:glycosyltransferase [Symploca sp. SIO1C4]
MTLNQADSLSPKPILPQVSVIVPIYNGETDIPDLIRCLQAQTYPVEQVEYLLVNNSSRDRTAAILAEAASVASSQGITIKPLQENKIQSSYAARNTGIRVAKSDLLAFTDADCRPQSDWLEQLIAPFVDEDIGIVVGEIAGLPGDTLLEKHAEHYQVLSQQHTLAHPFCPYGQTANLAIRRQAFKEVGLFRPYLTTGGDADICWRIQRQSNWKLKFISTAVVQHRHRSTIKEYESQWRRYGRSNLYLHELHGVDLMREKTTPEYAYMFGRWLLKELPINSVKAMAGKIPAIEIISTPIGIFGAQARSQGQRLAQLPENAREIEWLQDQ